VLLLAGLVAWPLAQRRAPAEAEGPIVEPEPRPSEAPARAAPPAAGDGRTTTTAVARSVRLVSEPSGAEVYRGPKLLGTTPLTLAPLAPVEVTLVHPGFEDLVYTVGPGDAPALTLRLPHKKGHHVAAAPGPAAPVGKGGRKVHVDAVDDGKPPRVPKVEAIDD
jgi:hypothetical protein